ncbi:hypothetical protein [Anaerotalea alkaliphila]|uniref:Uncharacterized protein n=1 Tax=Anaerotalea alkaliphila TaxID=2662126 RepID=A0A7X5HXN1_9FIRM|nr:hypothetical protein [Anaerotalea alkaliphila]NDL68505.1 hypothetical protein [Anaerotalea alkaliphila]
MTRFDYIKSLDAAGMAEELRKIQIMDAAHCDGSCNPDIDKVTCTHEEELACVARWLQEDIE